MANRFHWLPTVSPSFPEPLAVNESQARAGRTAQLDWIVKRRKSASHRILAQDGWPDYVFAFHDGETIGPRIWLALRNEPGSRRMHCDGGGDLVGGANGTTLTDLTIHRRVAFLQHRVLPKRHMLPIGAVRFP